MAKEMTTVALSYATGFLMEAVDEINLTLEAEGYGENISEDDLIGESPRDGGFAGDAYFTFAASLPDSYDGIRAKLSGTGVDVSPVTDWG